MLAQLVEGEQPLGQLGAQDLQVDLVRDVEADVVDAVQQPEVPVEDPSVLGQPGLGQVRQPVVMSVLAQSGRLDRVQRQQVVQRRLGHPPPPLLHEGALLCALPQ